MSLRRDVHSAFDQISPGTHGLSERVVTTVLAEGATRPGKGGITFRLRAPLSLVAVFLVVALVSAIFIGGRLLQDWKVFQNPAPATTTYQSQVAQLEAVPLHLPVYHSAFDCRTGPYSPEGSLGEGPIFMDGGSPSFTAWGVYFHNLAYAKNQLNGPVLIRVRDLFGNQPIVFVARYAAGAVVGSDRVDGQTLDQHLELLINANNALRPPGLHKFSWPFILGVPSSWSGAIAWQIDGVGFSEVFVIC